ncbi:AMP-binding protein [Streptomyces sp. NPDC048481]|uniref:AMP-binding protein n=1 Tax=Streptomyces sp. NPDC048481 TaxID=3365557 RepID=UPI0037242B6D
MTEPVPDAGLHHRFLGGLRAAPDRPALCLGAAEQYSYRELHDSALLWAGALVRRLGRRPRRVAVLAGKNRTGYAGVLAALYSGAAAVPLHVRWPAGQIGQMLRAAEVEAVIADPDGLVTVREAGLDLPVLCPDLPGGAGTAAGLVREEPGDALAEPSGVALDDIAYVLFTSGSTGRPKGVPLTHANFLHYFAEVDARYDFGAGDAFAQTVELNFDCAIFDLFCAWGAGACVHPVPPTAYLDLPGFVRERGVTVWFSTPSAVALVRRTGGLTPGSMPGLRWSFFAGEALKCADAADWQRAVGHGVVENLYGPTELTITVSVHRWSARTSPGLAVNGIVPIGALHGGLRARTLDADGQESDEGGELCVSGPQLTPGYLDARDGVGRFFVADGRTWYRTGDRVVRTAGQFAYVGRLDSQVQIKGLRVELAEVDNAARACPGVSDAVAVVRPADDSLELVVFYTGEPVAPAAFLRHLRPLLPGGALPREFRRLTEFPLNSNRKTDRKALAAQALVRPEGADRSPSRAGAGGTGSVRRQPARG